MQIPRVWRQALVRIAAMVGVLSVVLGGLQYWVEVERLDSTVVLLAQREAEDFVGHHLRDKAVDLGDPKLVEVVRSVLLAHFPIVEFYDLDRKKRLEAVAPGKEWIEAALRERKHGFPADQTPIYHRLDLRETTFIQVLIPLPVGIFEGVYEVDAETTAEIKRSMVRAVLGIVLSVVATGVLLFPLLISLNREVVRTSTAILNGNIELLDVLGSAIAKRDSDTSAHNYRVTLYAIELARAIKLPDSQMRALIAGSFLHDVGKIGIPDGILLKPGKLDAGEFEIMKTHVELGGHILQRSTWLATAREVVLNHHEKYDGSGYPRGLGAEAIPIAARIFAIVDVFDALTSRRPYKEPMSLEQSLAILKQDAGSHFDPVLIEAFARIAPDLYARLVAMSDAEAEELLRRSIAAYFVLS
ncbi:MAG: HD-GYP domain-containing protein [Rhodocyclales bacterium]|nr:HD-GYP domain-containing protein [Rhodocyclales bacterium]